MLEFLKQYIGELITALIAGGATYLFQAKRQKSEVETNEIENAIKALQYYREMADDLGQRLAQAIKELNSLEAKVEALTAELKKYKQLNGKIE